MVSISTESGDAENAMEIEPLSPHDSHILGQSPEIATQVNYYFVVNCS